MSTVLVDMDGVLADFDGPLFRYFGAELDCTPETQIHRFLTNHLPDEWLRRQMRAMVEGNRWFARLPVMPGAKEGVKYLQDAGHDVWIVSKPLEASRSCASDKFEWVEEHFPSLVGKLILAPDKGLVKGDYLIDDAIKPSWLEYATWEPIVFDHPWNRTGAHSLGSALRMYGWADVGEVL